MFLLKVKSFFLVNSKRKMPSVLLMWYGGQWEDQIFSTVSYSRNLAVLSKRPKLFK